jgi:PIN domain nuclease of toxin-antitoxin system
MTYVTDTHPIIWFLEAGPRLSQAARQAFEDANAQIVVPMMALAEVKFLYDRGRITVDLPMVLNYIATRANSLLYPLNELVVARFPTTLNIHDAIIVGTAITYRDDLGEQVALITKDAEITASGLVDVVW